MVAGLNFKTDGAWGSGNGLGTGGNLTPAQADENTWTLHQRILAIESNPPTAVGILGFTVIGSQFQVNMSDGSTLGPYDLPIATFRDMGIWTNNMPLLKLDIIEVPHDGVYIVNIAHTTPASPAVFNPDADDGSGNLLYTKVYGDDAYIYDLSWFYPGSPGLGIDTGAPMASHEFGRPVVMPTGLTDSKASLRVAPAGAISYDIQVNGVVKGSVDFASGSTAGTFTWTADVNGAVGDIISLMRPTTPDSAAKDLTVTLILTREFDT